MLNQLFIIHQRSAFIIHYSPKILSNEWWILNNEKWIIQNENPADKNRQDFRFGGSGWILCAPWFFDRSERLRKSGGARDFTVPKAYRGFWAASTEPPSVVLILLAFSYQNKKPVHSDWFIVLAVTNYYDAIRNFSFIFTQHGRIILSFLCRRLQV